MAMFRNKYTRLRISGLEIPAGADWEISEDVRLIGEAYDIRRTVNGDARNVARSAFQKYALSYSARDHFPAALAGVAPGQYAEVVPIEPFAMTWPAGQTAAYLPRACTDIIGVGADGARIEPAFVIGGDGIEPLQTTLDPARVATLRTQVYVAFTPDSLPALVRYRPILACLVTGWSSSSDEAPATAAWSLDLEEV